MKLWRGKKGFVSHWSSRRSHGPPLLVGPAMGWGWWQAWDSLLLDQDFFYSSFFAEEGFGKKHHHQNNNKYTSLHSERGQDSIATDHQTLLCSNPQDLVELWAGRMWMLIMNSWPWQTRHNSRSVLELQTWLLSQPWAPSLSHPLWAPSPGPFLLSLLAPLDLEFERASPSNGVEECVLN